MKKTALLFALIYFYNPAFSQVDSVSLRKMADKIAVALNDPGWAEKDFGPVKFAQANMIAFSFDNGYISGLIRKLLIAKKFAGSKALFAWLLPVVNKIALEEYLDKEIPLSDDERKITQSLSKDLCPCFEMGKRIGLGKLLTDSATSSCIKHVLTDTATTAAFYRKELALPQQQRMDFITRTFKYLPLYCDVSFDVLMSPTFAEISDFYDQTFDGYKRSMLNSVAHYSADGLNDSLVFIFPTYKQFLPQVQSVAAIYKQHNGPDMHYSYDELVKTTDIERKSSFVFVYVNGKGKVLGQAVYEIGIDKPNLYIKSLTFYPREKIQNVEKLESTIPLPPADN